MTRVLWLSFKFLLSLVLLLLAAGVLVGASSRNDPAGLGVASAFVFLAALPWVNLANPSRALGLTGVVVSLGLGAVAYSRLAGTSAPRANCHGRGKLYCYIENLLFHFGGPLVVGLLWAVLAAALMTLSLRLLAGHWNSAPGARR